VESERHIDLFADLHLGLSDDEAGDGNNPDIVRDGIAQLVPLLPRSEPNLASVPSQAPTADSSVAGAPQTPTPSKHKGGWKKGSKTSNKKTSPWANKCMYAELLEMQETDLWPGMEDGLPGDLETGWVALAPIPVGKRCIAISHQGGGMIGAGASTACPSHDTTTDRSLHQCRTRRSALASSVNLSYLASHPRCHRIPSWTVSWIKTGRKMASSMFLTLLSGKDRILGIANRLSGQASFFLVITAPPNEWITASGGETRVCPSYRFRVLQQQPRLLSPCKAQPRQVTVTLPSDTAFRTPRHFCKSPTTQTQLSPIFSALSFHEPARLIVRKYPSPLDLVIRM
jgi:hypothetical protein